jgi:hypothetical protein
MVIKRKINAFLKNLLVGFHKKNQYLKLLCKYLKTICYCDLKLKYLFIILDYVRKYATEEALRDQENGGTGNGVSSDSESSMSDFSEDEAQDMEL